MNLVLSDKELNFSQAKDVNVHWIDLSNLHISNCVGCFGCWTKTPGKCVIRDDAVRIYPLIAESSQIIYVTKIKYGGYDTVMKAMLERSIPVQQAFIRLLQGETHHVQRNVATKKAVIIGYGERWPDEREIFTRLVERNAKNMNFGSYKVQFAKENELEEVVRKEVALWKKQ